MRSNAALLCIRRPRSAVTSKNALSLHARRLPPSCSKRTGSCQPRNNAERLPDAVAATNLVQMKQLDAAGALLAGCHTTGSHQICLLVSHWPLAGMGYNGTPGMGFVGTPRFDGLLTRWT